MSHKTLTIVGLIVVIILGGLIFYPKIVDIFKPSQKVNVPKIDTQTKMGPTTPPPSTGPKSFPKK